MSVYAAQQLADISPSDFYMFVHLKPPFLSSPISNQRYSSSGAFYMLVKPFASALGPLNAWTMIRRVRGCVGSGGGCFEHLL
jgi:hypothetical protein